MAASRPERMGTITPSRFSLPPRRRTAHACLTDAVLAVTKAKGTSSLNPLRSSLGREARAGCGAVCGGSLTPAPLNQVGEEKTLRGVV